MELRRILEALVAGHEISGEQAAAVAEAIAAGTVEEHQLSALLALLAARGESGAVVAGFASVMRAHVVPVPHSFPVLTDIVGTGGDGHNTINISTASAVVAAACGAHVAKHGSLSVSSRSGAADVISALGAVHLAPSQVAACLQTCGLAFLFAPHFHPVLGKVAKLRKALGIRTVFNILGPLLNPLGAKRLVLGVYQTRLLPVYAEAVAALGAEHALIVHCCGLDEFAPVGPAEVVEVRRLPVDHALAKAHAAGSGTTAAAAGSSGGGGASATVGGSEAAAAADAASDADSCTVTTSADGTTVTITRRFVYDPLAECGMPRCTIAALEGGSPADNAAIITRVLGGSTGGGDAPIAQAIALNAGAALYVSDLAGTIEAGYGLALACMTSGSAGKKLAEFAGATQSLHAAAVAVAVAGEA